MDRFFFAQDDDDHWYMVPAERRDEWQAWAGGGFDWTEDFADDASAWLIDGGIEQFTFADPFEVSDR